MPRKQTIQLTMTRTQIILLPALFGGFMGSDLLKGSLPVDKLLAFLVFYGIVNIFIFYILKSQVKKK